ncbi:MAG: type II toxin-antitoxin system VapB family antitoxin [Ignavibacteriae bacterium]|nr:type II toxin-antitoxin system VapB family antitoxin [Ignavibacteriota bacterium]
MRTNIILDDTLVETAMKLGKIKTKKEIVHIALEEFVKNLQRKSLMDLKGKIKFSKNYDYKAMRT